MIYNNLKRILGHFRYVGRYLSAEELTSGNINATYCLRYAQADGGVRKYILQRINTVAFRDPESVMRNIGLVSEHIAAAMTAAGIDTDRRILEFIRADNGTLLFEDENHGFWRSYIYVDHATAHDYIDDPALFYEAGRGFGEFQRYLTDFPAEKLAETIPNFHNTEKRFYDFVAAVAADRAGRAAGLEKEIDFFFDRRKMMSRIVRLMADGKLPARVTHNDTKLNNVLIDDLTGKALCVIDLDTVMPGSVLYDYGDAVRYGASTAAEDEPDVSKIDINMDLFRRFTDGFLEGTAGTLTPEEIRCLPLGIHVITCELAMRFLTDYLNGDEYFKVDYPDHNLVRAWAQMALLAQIEKRYDEMNAYVKAAAE